MLWFTVVFLVLLKIPLVYLCYVVWWAVKDPPAPGGGLAGAGGESGPDDPDRGSSSWWRRSASSRPLRRGPHGSPVRRPRPAFARARAREPR